VASDTVQRSRDWLRSPRTNLLAWWIPQVAILAGLFVPVTVRAALWIVVLFWMGTACLLNARRCGRTHCRYTGPYYLAMIAPVLVLASGLVTVNFNGWLVLGGSFSLEARSFGGPQSGRGEHSRSQHCDYFCPVGLAHVPAKWTPVLRQGHAPIKLT
jgi:hypothetical protein